MKISNTLKTTCSALALVALVGVAPAMADSVTSKSTMSVDADTNMTKSQTVETDTDVSVDANGNVTTTKTKTTTTTYTTYDVDNNGIDEQEFVNYSYDVIDYNNDNMISDDEWDTYTTVWYSPYDIDYDNREFTYYDIDGDGYIEAVEYEKAYDVSVFKAWDMDGDGVFEKTEYSKLPDVYAEYDVNSRYTW